MVWLSSQVWQQQITMKMNVVDITVMKYYEGELVDGFYTENALITDPLDEIFDEVG